MKQSKKETVINYRREIDTLTNGVRRWLGKEFEQPTKDQIMTYTENLFFDELKIQGFSTESMQMIINAAYTRASNKYGILTELIDDVSVNEIMVNGPEWIYVERNHRIEPVDDAFTSEAELEEIMGQSLFLCDL